MLTATATAIKWRRGPVIVQHNEGYPVRHSYPTFPGYLPSCGNLAIYRPIAHALSRWRVTHQPSGLMLCDLKRLALAKCFVARIVRECDLSALDQSAAGQGGDGESLDAIRRIVRATKQAGH